jgi:hypothetical protein
MKGYVAVPVRLPIGELTGYIGITEGKVPKEFHPTEDCLGSGPAKSRGFLVSRPGFALEV